MQLILGSQEYSENFHKAVFNKKYLEELLLEVGFKTIKEWDPKTIPNHNFEDWSSKVLIREGKEYPISLNIEAIK